MIIDTVPLAAPATPIQPSSPSINAPLLLYPSFVRLFHYSLVARVKGQLSLIVLHLVKWILIRVSKVNSAQSVQACTCVWIQLLS